MQFIKKFLAETQEIIQKLDRNQIEESVDLLVRIRARGGRLFVLGVGGSAANASHAVNDFRKIAHFEAYAPTDNVSELTARINDSGWESVFTEWLKISRLNANDGLLVLSVGGGDKLRNVSPNLVSALLYAQSVGASILGIVGRDGGFTATVADACVLIPDVNPQNNTGHAEAFQAIIWHLLAFHPKIKQTQSKWEEVLTCKEELSF
jgi:D-sedoheptulose 7-phosphate isomerase